MKLDEVFRFIVILQPGVPKFIYEGIKKQSTCNKALMILEYVMQVEEFHNKISLDYLQLLNCMERQFVETDVPIVKQNILGAMFNLTYLDNPTVETFFIKLDYDSMFLSVDSETEFDFLDLCLSALSSFPT
jgi:hypothetical protein